MQQVFYQSEAQLGSLHVKRGAAPPLPPITALLLVIYPLHHGARGGGPNNPGPTVADANSTVAPVSPPLWDWRH
jgi:hypothetical protein